MLLPINIACFNQKLFYWFLRSKGCGNGIHSTTVRLKSNRGPTRSHHLALGHTLDQARFWLIKAAGRPLRDRDAMRVGRVENTAYLLD